MLVARELLNLVTSMIEQLKLSGYDAIPEASVHAQYIAIVCMMRSVGQVVEKVDCVDAGEKQFLKACWPIWRQADIFRNFIEPTRNDLLKEFKSRLALRGSEDVSHITFANPRMTSGATLALHFEPSKLRDVHGRLIMPLFEEAIAFWDKCLKEVEAFRASSARL